MKKNILSICIAITIAPSWLSLTAESNQWVRVSTLSKPLVVYSGCSYRGTTFLAADSALLSSIDNGVTWRPHNLSVNHILEVYCGQGILLAGNYLDLRLSRDGGSTWVPTSGISDVGDRDLTHLRFAQCQTFVFANVNSMSKDGYGTKGVIYYLDKTVWKEFLATAIDEVWQLNCHGMDMFIGQGGKIWILEVGTGPIPGDMITSMSDGLRRPCEDSRFGCEIGEGNPIISTPFGAYLPTGYGIFRYRDNQTGWDLINNNLPPRFGSARVAVKCGHSYYLPGASLFELNIESPSSAMVTVAAEMPDSNAFFWSNGNTLFSVSRMGEVLQFKCN